MSPRLLRIALLVLCTTLLGGTANASQIISFGGDLTLTNSTIFNMTVGGPNRGTDYDSLAVAGQAKLAGTLNFLVINNFVPTVGEQFQALSYSSFTGAFGSINPSGLAQGQFLTADYRANGLFLTVGTNAGASVTPEPSTLALLGTGLLGVVGAARRRFA